MMIQKEIQELLNFDIKKMRSFTLKKHEVLIPLKVINSKESIEILKDLFKSSILFIISNRRQ
jgi:hypothetical protein